MSLKSHTIPIPNWQKQLTDSFTDPEELLKFLDVKITSSSEIKCAGNNFPFRVTKSFASRMRKRDMEDPLLRQVLPTTSELRSSQGFSINPVGDLEAVVSPGILHKYQGRVLLIATAACAINCRYCFRRDFPYHQELFNPSRTKAGLKYILDNPDIREVILSGGDPLVLGDAKIDFLITSIAAIPHVRRIRIHTRLPIVLPDRITPMLIDSLTKTRLKPVIVLHANHPHEINTDVALALSPLRKANIPLFNQTVLLRTINDNARTLIDLSEALFAIGVIPYYLHVLDKAAGTSYFDIPLEKAKFIHNQLLAQLSGYLVPKLVCEKPGAPNKIPL